MIPYLRPAVASLGLALPLALAGCQTTGSGAGGELAGVLGGVLGEMGTESGAGELTAAEVEAGLRQALSVGTERVAAELGRTDGYFGDPQIRIPLPGRLGELQRTLDGIGLAGPLNDLQLRLNRAAEDAVPQARTLVLDAVASITLDDALAILNGGDTAATDFLRTRTETGLRAALTPHMRSALDGSGAYAALDSVARHNGLGGLSASLRDDITQSAVNYGLDGLFVYIAAEEKRIREEPVARTTELLRKVFGSR